MDTVSNKDVVRRIYEQEGSDPAGSARALHTRTDEVHDAELTSR
jgi:hypothetical protein